MQLIGVASGFFFGIYLGTLYLMTGQIIGTFLVLLIAKRFGRPLLHKMFSEKKIKTYENLANKIGLSGIFILYLIPLTPKDLITYVVGLSKIPLTHLLIVITVARLPLEILLVVLGAYGSLSKTYLLTSIFTIFLLILISLFFHNEVREDYKKIMLKISNFFKKPKNV